VEPAAAFHKVCKLKSTVGGPQAVLLEPAAAFYKVGKLKSRWATGGPDGASRCVSSGR